MSCDPRCTALAAAFLKDAGWNNTLDIHRLAEGIQSFIEDYLCDLDAKDMPELEDR